MKNSRVKNLLIGVLAAGLTSMTFAYALLSQRLDINSTAKVNKSTWDIHFSDGQSVNGTGTNSGTVKTAPTLSNYSINGMVIELTKPGDSASYKFNIVNGGTIDAKITDYKKLVSSIVCKDKADSTTSADATGVCSNLNYKISYTSATTAAQTGTAISAGTELAENQILKAGQTVNVTLTLTYNSASTFVPTDDVTITGLDSYIVYTQN